MSESMRIKEEITLIVRDKKGNVKQEKKIVGGAIVVETER